MSRRDVLQARHDRRSQDQGSSAYSSMPPAPRGRGLGRGVMVAGLLIALALGIWFVARRVSLSGHLAVPQGLELQGTGTGFFISADGWFVTAAHVIEGAVQVELLTKEGVVTARVVRKDAINDVAILKAEGTFPALPLALDDSPSLGDSVFTVGFPMPGLQGQSPKLTRGDISSMAGIQDDPRHFQISVPVQPGNSGGPLCTISGGVVGVIVSRLSDTHVFGVTGSLPQNVNYALKSAYLAALLAPEPGVASLKIGSPVVGSSSVEQVEAAVALVVGYGLPENR